MPMSNIKTPNIWRCWEQIPKEVTFKLKIEGWIVALCKREKKKRLAEQEIVFQERRKKKKEGRKEGGKEEGR